MFCICRVLYFIADFIWLERLYWDLGTLLGLISLTIFIFLVEKYVYTRSKYIFSAVGSFAIVWDVVFLLIIYNVEYIYLAQAVFLPIIASIVPIIYLYVAIRSSGEPRTKSLIILLGILIFMVANVLHYELLKVNFAFGYYILSPACFIVGLIIFVYGMLK